MTRFVPVGQRPQPLVVHERPWCREQEAKEGGPDQVGAARPEEVKSFCFRQGFMMGKMIRVYASRSEDSSGALVWGFILT